MAIMDTIKANLGSTDAASLRRTFSPPHMADGADVPIRETFLEGRTSKGAVWLRESPVGGWIRGVRRGEAAGAPVAAAASAQAAAAAVGAAPNLGFAGGGGAQQLAAPIYGGLLAQHVAQERAAMLGAGVSPVYAFAAPQAAAATAAAAAAPAAAEVVAEVAPVAGDAAKLAGEVAPVADDAAAHSRQMELFLVEAFQHLGKADDATRLAVLSTAVDLQAVKFGSETAAELLGRTLAEAPLEQSTTVLAEAIGKVSADAGAAAAAAKAAGAAAHEAPAAVKVADAAAHAASAIADAAHAAAAVTRGGGRMMSMTSAIAEALRVLPKV